MISRHKLSDVLPIAAIVLICVLALMEVLLLLVDRQLSKGVTYKDVDLAAWVQAVGSILAIIASVALVWWSSKAERSRLQAQDTEKARRFLTAVHVLVEQLRDEAFSIGMSRTLDLMAEPSETRRMQRTRL